MRALYDVESPVWQLAHPRDSTETETERHLNAPFTWRLEPNVSFARPR